MGSKRERNKHEHRHLTDAEAEEIARSMPNEEGMCYMCQHKFVAGDQITQTVVPNFGTFSLCTPCAHEATKMFEKEGISIPWIGEPLRNEHHEVSYDGKDFIYRG